MDVRDKVAVITGASRGLGAGMAEVFAAKGMRLGLCARGPAALEPGDDVVTLRLDVAELTAVEAFCGLVVERFGRIDLWINNAGVLDPIAPLRDVDQDDFERSLAVNVGGVVNGTRAFLHHLRDRGGDGVLVNITSGAGQRGYAGWSAYCAGKGAVDRITECVALEEAGTGLRAYAVSPGVVETGMQEAIRASSDDVFPEAPRFRQQHEEGRMNSPAWVAEHILRWAFGAERPEGVLLRVPEEHP